MKIIFQDRDIIVCIKPAGVFSTDEPGGMPGMIRQEIGADKKVRTVHRLDSIVSGLMVYALSREAASGLTEQIEDGSFVKEYLAVTEGHPAKVQDTLQDHLWRNQKERKTYAVEKTWKDAQEASLFYHVLDQTKENSLVRVRLITGRTHQIRAQFSSRGLPLYGDKKYGSFNKDVRIALWSFHLSFTHPVTNQKLDFTAMPPSREPWDSFRGYHEEYAEQDVVAEFQRGNSFFDCSFSHMCDGCAYAGMEYEKQLEKKQKQTGKWLRQFGRVEDIIPAGLHLSYKKKATVKFGFSKEENIIGGLQTKAARNGFKKVIPLGKCRMYDPSVVQISDSLCDWINQNHIPLYDEVQKTGWLRAAQIIVYPDKSGIRSAEKSNERLEFGLTDSVSGMLILVAVSRHLPFKKDLLTEWLEIHPEIKTVILNVNHKKTPAILGKEEEVLYGPGYLQAEICGRKYQCFTRSYFPENLIQTEKLYQKAMELAALTGMERVLDVCCNTGILSILAAEHAKRVLAVDLYKDVVREAEQNAALNQVSNVKWICSDPVAYVETLARSHEKIDVVFFNSVCSRITEKHLRAAAAVKPEKIILISGNPEYLSKDLEVLKQKGYQAEKIQPVDTLPYQTSADIVCLLSKVHS